MKESSTNDSWTQLNSESADMQRDDLTQCCTDNGLLSDSGNAKGWINIESGSRSTPAQSVLHELLT